MNSSLVTFYTKNIYSNYFTPDYGLYQGSSLSAILFLDLINEIFKTFFKPMKYTLFTNVCSLYCSSFNVNITAKLLQKQLRFFTHWSNKIGFFCFLFKTKQIIYFSKWTIIFLKIIVYNVLILFLDSIKIQLIITTVEKMKVIKRYSITFGTRMAILLYINIQIPYSISY